MIKKKKFWKIFIVWNELLLYDLKKAFDTWSRDIVPAND